MMITKTKINIIMSEKRKLQRARHEEQEKKNAERIIFGIIAVLILLAIVFMVSTAGLF